MIDKGSYIVATHPDHERKGVCPTLVYESSKFAFQNLNVNGLIMVADENYHAARIYESVGFKPSQKHYGLYKWW